MSYDIDTTTIARVMTLSYKSGKKKNRDRHRHRDRDREREAYSQPKRKACSSCIAQIHCQYINK